MNPIKVASASKKNSVSTQSKSTQRSTKPDQTQKAKAQEAGASPATTNKAKKAGTRAITRHGGSAGQASPATNPRKIARSKPTLKTAKTAPSQKAKAQEAGTSPATTNKAKKAGTRAITRHGGSAGQASPAATKKSQPEKYPVFHLFTYKGRKFLFETAKSFFIELDGIAYDVLSHYSPDLSVDKNLTHFTPKNLPDKEFILSKLQRKYPRRDLEGVFREIEKLKTLGLFLPEQKEKKEEMESYINRLTHMTSSNLTLIVSQACNLACKYCYAESGTFGRASKFMSEEMAKKSVDYLFEKTRGAKQVGLTFFGGEPLLNFKVIKFCVEYSKALARKNGQRMGFSLTTNGAVMTDEMVELLCTNRFGLKVSLDGPKEVQDEMRPFKNGRGSYDVVAKNLKKLLDRRRHLSVRPTLTRHNLDVRALAKFFEEFGFTRIGFGFSTGTCFQKENYDLKHEHMEKLFKQDEETAYDIFDRLSKNLPVKYNPFENVVSSIHNRTKTRIRCGLGRGVSSVSVEGDIYPCHRYVGMENYIIGHIDQGIDKERVKDLLWDYYRVKDYCWKTCWARHLCGGPCPWYAAHPDGHHRFPDKAHCEFIRRGFEFGIWFYDELRRRFPTYLEKLVAL